MTASEQRIIEKYQTTAPVDITELATELAWLYTRATIFRRVFLAKSRAI